MSNSNKKSKITIKVGLDENKHPQSIHWSSDDNPSGKKEQEAKAMLISFFDKEYKDTYKIDLWTTEMQVAEMDRFVFQSLRAMAETYFKATGNQNLANDMRRFVQYFGEATEIIPKDNSK
jgi:gliding motility-associated protein GldC